jgi:uncharacterized protein YaaN involved in tellurite resistance
LKYEARTDKKTEIVEREYEKIKARVSNFEGKVAMCQLVIDKLQNFKPKPLIRVEFQEKKLDREDVMKSSSLQEVNLALYCQLRL